MKVRALSFLCLGLLLGDYSLACRRAPSPDRPIEAPASGSRKVASGDLTLKKGLKIKLAPHNGGPARVLTVDNPSGAEGLSFDWQLEAASGGQAESVPTADAAGKMTLANTVDGRRMTLPAFWPGGELFLSNSSAVWLSDRAFSDLKKAGQTQWDLGLADNALVGPLQGNDLVEASLELTGRALDANPDRKAQALQIKVSDKSVDYRLKVNGTETKVDALEAENSLARLTILDNAQNPLVLQVEVAPEASAASRVFLPLSWVRDALSYRVEEITLR